MKKIILLVLIATVSCSPHDEIGVSKIYNLNEYLYTEGTIEHLILKGINDYRKSIELHELVGDIKTTELSNKRSDNLVILGELSHEGFNSILMELSSLGADSVGEVLGFGHSYSDSIMNAWIDSKNHEIIISGNYDWVGISVKEDEKGEKYYCVIFAGDDEIN